MIKKLTAFVCASALLFASCSKEVKAPDQPLGKLVISKPVDLLTAISAASPSQGVEIIRSTLSNFTYTGQEPCSYQLVQMTGTQKITYFRNTNTGTIRVVVDLSADGTLQDGETYHIDATQTENVVVGEEVTLKIIAHYHTNHHGGFLNWNVKGVLVSSYEFDETFVVLAMNCD